MNERDQRLWCQAVGVEYDANLFETKKAPKSRRKRKSKRRLKRETERYAPIAQMYWEQELNQE